MPSEGYPSPEEPLESWRPRRWPKVAVSLAVLAALAGGAFLVLRPTPAAPIVELGNLSVLASADPAQTTATLPHDRFVRLTATVQSPVSVEIGAKGDPYVRDSVRVFVKLDGALVIAALDGQRPDLKAWRDRHGSLLGLPVEGVGRLVDPERVSGYEATASALRTRFNLKPEQAFRVFDTQDHP